MFRKIKYPFLCFCLFAMVAGTGLTGCGQTKVQNKISDSKDKDKTIKTDSIYKSTKDTNNIEYKEENNGYEDPIPQYPGGEVELMKCLQNNIKYPESAIKKKIQGKVIVSFVVTEFGHVDKIKVIKSLDVACDKEAVRVVKCLQSFIPAHQNGTYVSVNYTLPIDFKLK